MKVGELMALLASLDGDAEVVLQLDRGGNHYLPLRGADGDAVYMPETGDVYSTNWSAEEADMTAEDWDAIKAKPRCVVLYP